MNKPHIHQSIEQQTWKISIIYQYFTVYTINKWLQILEAVTITKITPIINIMLFNLGTNLFKIFHNYKQNQWQHKLWQKWQYLKITIETQCRFKHNFIKLQLQKLLLWKSNVLGRILDNIWLNSTWKPGKGSKLKNKKIKS